MLGRTTRLVNKHHVEQSLISTFHHPKIASSMVDVSGDLFSQGVDGRKLDLGTNALQKGQLKFCFGLQLKRMEVEQVTLNGEGIGTKGRAVANVGHRVEGFGSDAQARDVDAMGWHQLVVAGEVDGWNSVLVAVTTTP